MIRAGVAVVLIGLVGLFGYFYLTDRSGTTKSDKARNAAVQVGDVVVDEGIAELVRVRLTTEFGLERTRYLHVWHDNGKVLVYGLAPETLAAEQIRTEAAKVPGVSSVEVLVQARPAYLTPTPAAAEPHK